MFIPKDCFCNPGQGHTNSIIGGVLGFNYLIGSGAHLFFYLLKPSPACLIPGLIAEFQYGFGGQQGLAPRHKLTVPVLAHDIGVDIPWVRFQVIPQKVTQSGCVQGGSAAQHAPWIKTGKGACYPCHDVHRIGRNQENSVKAR